jgi:PAS domain S-box-containing protein
MPRLDRTQGTRDRAPTSTSPEVTADDSAWSVAPRLEAENISRAVSRIVRSRFVRNLAGLSTIGLALAVRLVLERQSITLPTYVTFYPVVLLAAVLGGMWAGIIATALSALLVEYLVLPPIGHLWISETSDIVSQAIFCLSGVLISIVCELYRRSREKLAAYQMEAAVENERRKVEEERQVAESTRLERQRFLDVLETLPTTISLLSTDHQIVFANRSFREKFGEPRGAHCFEACLGRTAPCDFCQSYQVLETGQPSQWEVTYRDGSVMDTYDVPFTDLDGQSLILKMGVDITERRRAETQLKEHREHLEALVAERTQQLQAANARLEADMRERERAEQGLRENRAKLAAALASMTDSVLITDTEGRFVDFNDAFARFYRFKSKFECARDFSEFSHMFDVFLANGEPAQEEMYAMRRALRGETATNAEYILRRKDTGETWMGSLSFSPIRDGDGTITGSVISARDVTETKQAEAALLRSEKEALQRQQLQALAERLQQVREEERKKVARDIHDQIGQILTAIKLDVAWAVRHLPHASEAVHDRLKGSMEMINEGVRSVRNICSGLRPGVLDDLGLAAAIEWQAQEFGSRTGISCEVTVPSSDLHMDGDRATAIFRIFQECLTNVARHAEARTVRTCMCEIDENLQLEIKDDGKGFIESDAAGSLGFLGMKERAQACGGNVEVSSIPGEGTTVTVRVPMQSTSSESEDHAYPDSR